MKNILFIVIYLGGYFVANGQSGTLDPSFGSAGVVTTTFGLIQATGKGMAIQTDGKIVLAGYYQTGTTSSFAVARYNINGTLDNTFDGDGKLTTVIGVNEDEAYAIAIQSDGKIVVAGMSHISGQPSQFAMVRYNTNGSLDNTFSGDGKVVTFIDASDAAAFAIVIQPDGKIVLAGNSYNATNTDFAVARYNTDGSLDNSFDGDGILTLAVTSSYDDAFSVALQSDGKIVVAGICGVPASSDFAVVRLNGLDGSLDNSFNGTGIVITTVDDATDNLNVAIQTDSKIVVAGSDGTNYTVIRYSSNGSLDLSFDTDGIVTTIIGAQSEAKSIVVQPDGKLLIGGNTFNGSAWDFALARYNTNGSLDNSFGINGIFTKNVNGNDFGYAMKLDGQRVYLGGVSNQVVFTLLAIQSGLTALPVSLSYFNASLQNKSSALNWQTESEQNTSHFDIERSIDGVNFSKVGEVNAIGNSSSTANRYQYSDKFQVKGVIYFRLKVVDFNDHFMYSSVISVANRTKVQVDVYPNPVTNVLKFQITSDEKNSIEWQIQNVTGVTLMKQSVLHTGNQVLLSVNVSRLANGVYFIIIKNGSETSIQRFIKQ